MCIGNLLLLAKSNKQEEHDAFDLWEADQG
jgi:hypothetical protein